MLPEHTPQGGNRTLVCSSGCEVSVSVCRVVFCAFLACFRLSHAPKSPASLAWRAAPLKATAFVVFLACEVTRRSCPGVLVAGLTDRRLVSPFFSAVASW